MKANGRLSLGCSKQLAMVVTMSVLGLVASMAARGQETTVSGTPIPAAPAPAMAASNLVTINVDNGPISQVLNAFSRQTGRSIVIGPEVAGNVTLRVEGIPWNEALDVILKPYGFGYYLVGDTIIICGMDKIPKAIALGSTQTVAASSAAIPAPKPPDPVLVKVFALKYLDAADVEDVIMSQLTPQRGKLGKMLIRSQTWQDQQSSQQGQEKRTSSESLGRLNRLLEAPDKVRGKTIVVVDTQEVIKALLGLCGDFSCEKPVLPCRMGS